MAELDSSACRKDQGVTKEFLLRKVREHSSGIVRRFWLGKLAQLSPFSPEEDAIDSDTISCHGSCLSSSVRALLSRPLVPLSGREDGPFVNAGLTLNWEVVGAHFAKGETCTCTCMRVAVRLSGCVGGRLTHVRLHQSTQGWPTAPWEQPLWQTLHPQLLLCLP